MRYLLFSIFALTLYSSCKINNIENYKILEGTAKLFLNLNLRLPPKFDEEQYANELFNNSVSSISTTIVYPKVMNFSFSEHFLKDLLADPNAPKLSGVVKQTSDELRIILNGSQIVEVDLDFATHTEQCPELDECEGSLNSNIIKKAIVEKVNADLKKALGSMTVKIYNGNGEVIELNPIVKEVNPNCQIGFLGGWTFEWYDHGIDAVDLSDYIVCGEGKVEIELPTP